MNEIKLFGLVRSWLIGVSALCVFALTSIPLMAVYDLYLKYTLMDLGAIFIIFVSLGWAFGVIPFVFGQVLLWVLDSTEMVKGKKKVLARGLD